MGQDREDRQGLDAGLNEARSPDPGQGLATPWYRDPAVFRDEIASATSYERGLLAKLAVALVIVGLVVLARVLFFS